MKVCEPCAGNGCRVSCILCPTCQGTGLISLGPESAERHAELVVKAREKAARLGWIEEAWVPLTEAEQRAQYPRLARKVFRAVTVEAQHQEVA